MTYSAATRRAARVVWLLLTLIGCPPPSPPTPPPPGKAPWPKFHHDKLQTGRSEFSTSANTGTLKWKFLTGGRVRSSPAIGADGTIYVGSDDRSLYALRPDGTPRWTVPTGGEVASSPAIGGDVIYVGSADGSLYAVNADGSLKWKLPLGGGAVYSSPAIADDGTVYIGTNAGSLHAVGSDGVQKWKLPLPTPGSIVTTPAIAPDGTIYVGAENPEFYAVTPTSGMIKWTFKRTGNPGTTSAAVGTDGTVYVGAQDGSLYALNPTDGTIKWSLPTKNNIVGSAPAIAADGTIYIGSMDQQVYAVDSTGMLKWTFGVLFANFRGSSPAIGSEGAIYVGAENGTVYGINPDRTTKWSFATGDSVKSSPAIGADGTIYVGSDDRYVYALGSPNPPAACCAPQQMVVQTVGAESLMQVSTVVAFPFPAGASITMDGGPADAGCRHDVIVPAGGFTVPNFCIPVLNFTVQMTAVGCAGGTARGAGVLWDAGAPAPAPNVMRVADTSDPDASSCGTLGTGCSTMPGGASSDTRGNIDTTRGGSSLAAGKLHARVDIPIHVRVWITPDASCPDGDGAYDAGTDTLITDFDFVLSPTTGTTGADFADMNKDGCHFAGPGPDHTKHCAHDVTVPCASNPQCNHCGVSPATSCSASTACPGNTTCITGVCVDGPLSGIPATGPCCTVGQTATLVYTGVAFSGAATIYDVNLSGRMRVAVTQCNAAPQLASCVLTTDPCTD